MWSQENNEEQQRVHQKKYRNLILLYLSISENQTTYFIKSHPSSSSSTYQNVEVYIYRKHEILQMLECGKKAEVHKKLSSSSFNFVGGGGLNFSCILKQPHHKHENDEMWLYKYWSNNAGMV